MKEKIKDLIGRIKIVGYYSEDNVIKLSTLFEEYKQLASELYRNDMHSYPGDITYLNDLIDKSELMIGGKSVRTKKNSFDDLRKAMLTHLDKFPE